MKIRGELKIGLTTRENKTFKALISDSICELRFQNFESKLIIKVVLYFEKLNLKSLN